MIKGRILFIVISFSQLIFSQAAPIDNVYLPAGSINYGFYAPTGPQVPLAVSRARKSVFLIYAALRFLAEDIDVSWGNGSKIKEQIASSVSFDALEKKIIIRQIEFCEGKQGYFNLMREKCQISAMLSRGSGFLANDGQTFWTALHVVRGVIGMREELALQKNSNADPLQVFIFDADGNLLIDPFETPIQPLYSLEIQKELGNFIPIANHDSIALKLPKAIGNPLPTVEIAPSENDPVFAIGFPVATGKNSNSDLELADRRPFPNSDGIHQFVSMGIVTDYLTAESVFKASTKDGSFPAQNNARAVFTNVDTVHGNSGGPVINSRGEVVGIVSTGTVATLGTSTQRATVLAVPAAWLGGN